MKLTVRPLTRERWPDLEALFNAKGCSVARGCWCMYYRRSGSRGPLPAGTTRAQANRAELKALLGSGEPPGSKRWPAESRLGRSSESAPPQGESSRER